MAKAITAVRVHSPAPARKRDAPPVDRKSRNRRLVRAALAMALVCIGVWPRPLVSAAAADETVSQVNVGRYTLYVDCRGTGGPTIVLSARFVERWDRVQPRLAAFSRTCAYDRAGNGMSGLTQSPITLGQLANDLHRLLIRGGIAGPYILVGEGLDGSAMRLYASEFRQSSVGVVLVDAIPVQDFRAADLALFGIQRIDLRTSRSQLRAASTLGNLPLVVLSHGVYLYFSQRIERTWRLYEHALSQLSTDSVYAIAKRSSYGIPQTQPEIVIEAVNQILLAVHSRARLRTCNEWLPGAGAACSAK